MGKTCKQPRLRCKIAAVLSFGLALGFSADSAHAAVNIANSPLFLTSSVEPNIMFIIDDSGSMQWETMPDELTNLFDQGCCANYMMWVYPRVNGLHGGADYANGTRVPSFDPAHIMARAFRSSTVNSLYYNPAITYRPWVNADGTPMPSATPTAAPNRPLFPDFGTRDLTANNTQTARWVDDRTNAHAEQSRTFYPAVYSTYIGPAVADILAAISDAGSPLWNLANYTWTEIRATTPTYTGEGRENRTDCLNAAATPPSCTYSEEIQNFANWYTYHRNRIFTSRAGIGRAFVDFGAEMRVGFGAINTHNFTVDNVSGSAVRRGVRAFQGTAKTNFYDDLYTLAIPPQGTPLRRALDGAGQYFSRNDIRGPWSDTPGIATAGENAADHLSCRQSFSILMTDGYTSGGDANRALHADRRANTDGTTAQNTTNLHPTDAAENFTYAPSDPFQDTRGNTLADVAMYYWKRDLRTDLDNRVPASDRNPAFWQHMVTYGVGLGVGGTIDPATAFASIPCPSCSPPVSSAPIAWPDPNFDSTNCNAGAGECAARVDDLLHAAVNSRGGFFSASDPDVFASELQGVLEDIVARVEASDTAAATSSAVLQTDTLLYTASFRSTDWSGTVTAREVYSDGSPGAEKWNAEIKMSAMDPADRKIFTMSGASKIPLLWDSLNGTQQAALEVNPSAVATTATGADRVAWLRGTEHGGLRNRSQTEIIGGVPTTVVRRIGDLVNSDPQFMFKRDFGYSLLPGAEGTSYVTFRSSASYLSRPDLLLVGSNDGMLHAFHAGTPYTGSPPAMQAEGGSELFAYMPSELLSPGSGAHARINELMASDYSHRYFVDGTPAVGDAYLDGSWKTVVVGTMGAGGRTVFALDVTNPTSFGASNVLWEFTHPDLGYGVSQPTIARLQDGTWVAIFGNGYNSTDHKAKLFVVELASGTLKYLVDTDVGSAASPNGLAAPVVTDWPAANLSATRVYAGDLQGNIWRFSLSVTPSVAKLFTATDGSGVPQPVTSRPSIALLPGDPQQVVVAFGTGSFFRTEDGGMSSPQTQTLYGVFDSTVGVTNVVRNDLLAQTIETNGAAVTIGSIVYPAGTLRRVSDNDVKTEKGWRVDLPVSGERVISEATFPSGVAPTRLRFSTLIPDDDSCGSGRDGWLMDIDLASGGRYSASVFDLNRDGTIDDDDKWGDNAVSGITGLTGERVTVIRNPDKAIDYLYAGDGEKIGDGLNTSSPVGRQSWRQLR